MYEIIQELGEDGIKAQLVVIAGRNKALEQQLKENADKFKLPMTVYGFTDRVHEIMAESNLIITKAGPGTIAEALTMNLPIIITSWLPGQEEGNVEFVVRENIGRVSRDPKKVVEIVRELMQPGEYQALIENIKRVSRPHAAIEIANEILRYL